MTKIFLALLINNVLIFINLKKFSKFINIYDRPDKKLKKHRFNIPILGGIIIFLNLAIFCFLSLIFDTPFKNLIISTKEYLSIMLLITSFFFFRIV